MTWSETLESAELLQQPLSTASSSCLQLCATTGAFDVFMLCDLIWSVSVFKLCWNHKLWLHCHMWTSYSVSFRIWPWIPQPLYFLYTNFHKVHVICNSPCLLDLTKDLISVLYLSSNICQKAKTTQYTKTNVTMWDVWAFYVIFDKTSVQSWNNLNIQQTAHTAISLSSLEMLQSAFKQHKEQNI